MKCAENPNIILIDKVLPESDILMLQAATDVFVSLHRSEGFGLNLAECMAAGKLVIGTNFSGNIDFMNETNSLLIDFDMRRVAYDEYIAGEGQWWADPKHESAVEAFRRASNDTTLRIKLGKAAQHDIKQKLSYEVIGSLMARALGDTQNPEK
jgi:glycosyltransferase involved in cell wall biosynthesis